MIIELKLFLYWLSLLAIFYTIAKFFYTTSNTSLKWKYWIEDNLSGSIFYMIKYLGIVILLCWLLFQFTALFFNAKMMLYTNFK